MTDSNSATPTCKIKLLYDGECPLCLREVNFLRQKDGGRGQVAFVDIAALDYNPGEYAGISYEAAMGRIHGILADGTVLRDVAVFRQVYNILGMGWVYGATRLLGVGAIANTLYRLWAHWRLRLTGRPSLPTLIAERQQKLGEIPANRCRLPHQS
ncbi:DUF393 domain-containing protein [Synechococcales cyanobacterium C]|uniref:DUF393 domain-containing protein n=1 Tax=Petrachloros mirabilis ULC683 TaxID=2781853 RepID=A0A8K2A700_9CYAN|nr:DUF393 domain-containing protein [Petrachloros mirabilis ULC683]